MMFVVVLNYIKPLSAIDPYLQEHYAFLDRHYAAGHFVASGPQNPRTGGVILAKCPSKDKLELVLAEDPFYREKIADYRIIEFEPTRFSPGVDLFLI